MTSIDNSRADRAGIIDRSSNRFGRALRFVRQEGFREVARLVRQHGARQSIHFVGRNLRHATAHALARQFDRKHGIDTAGSIQLDELQIVGPNRSLGHECVCTSPKSFRWIIKRVQVAPGSCFVDIGSGKGRTLLLASLRPFKRVIGVEFAKELVDISRENIGQFHRMYPTAAPIRVVHRDASEFNFPHEPLVIYLFNPFERDLLHRVLRNLAQSLEQKPRPCVLIYTTSNKTSSWALPCIEQIDGFTRLESGKTPFFLDAVRTLEYAIYRFTAGCAMVEARERS